MRSVFYLAKKSSTREHTLTPTARRLLKRIRTFDGDPNVFLECIFDDREVDGADIQNALSSLMDRGIVRIQSEYFPILLAKMTLLVLAHDEARRKG